MQCTHIWYQKKLWKLCSSENFCLVNFEQKLFFDNFNWYWSWFLLTAENVTKLGIQKGLRGGMKSKKSPSAYVLVHRNCFMRRAIILFVSASIYDYDKVFANFLHHCQCSKKFFTTPKVISSQSQNSNFLHHFESLVGQSGLKEYETQKITISLRFCL